MYILSDQVVSVFKQMELKPNSGKWLHDSGFPVN